jgi:hypothetical protein
MARRVLLLLEDIRSQNQTQILLLQQLLLNKASREEDSDVVDEFGLPNNTINHLMKNETDCQDRDKKAKLVGTLDIIKTCVHKLLASFNLMCLGYCFYLQLVAGADPEFKGIVQRSRGCPPEGQASAIFCDFA